MRIYVIASAQHNSPFGSEPEKDDSQQLANPLPGRRHSARVDGGIGSLGGADVSPPPSRYPRADEGTLVPPDPRRVGFPRIPGVRFHGLHNRQLFLDYGPNIHRGLMDVHPPRQIGNRAYTILVPKVDSDGNDIAGIRLPSVEVPLGTYTGWNLRPEGLAEDELSGLLGSFIPFARTKSERQKTGDPRPSLEERYRDQADYVQCVARAARALVEKRYLLPDDAARIINEAEQKQIGGRERLSLLALTADHA